MIDTHAHLDDERFADDLGELVDRALAAGVEKIVTVGISLETSRKAIAIAKQFSSVVAAVGIQPNCCHECAPDDWDAIVSLAEEPEVVALGETGLDRYWDDCPFELQQDYFDRHLRLSQERDLAVLIHCRDCDDDMVKMLTQARSRGPIRGLIHAMSGSADMATACLEMGLYLSFAGMASYTNRKFRPLREIVQKVPADRILLETDSPYLIPHPLRGKQSRNEPALVQHTRDSLAELRGESIEQFDRQSTENARRLFGIF
jgi:TatD DNase family protein